MNVKKIFQEDRRLCILRILKEAHEWSCNHYVLQTCLDQLGHSLSRDVVKTELAWLEENGLVKVEALESIMIAELTSRGLDVAEGKSLVYGVKKPVPGE